MYYYLVENSKKAEYDKIADKVEEILTNYDILGEFEFVNSLADVPEAVNAGFKKGFSTIVAVGGDQLANKIAVNLIDTKAALGILPIEEGLLSFTLGLGNWKTACEILAARRILLMDSAMVNEKPFVMEVLASESPDIAPAVTTQSIFSKLLGGGTKKSTKENNPISVSIEEEYQIESQVAGLVVSNLRPYGKDIESIRQSMIDNNLHLAFSDIVESGDVYNSLSDNIKAFEQNNVSLFHLEKMSIRSEKPMFFWSSQEVIARTPAEFTILPQSLKIIGGRLR